MICCGSWSIEARAASVCIDFELGPRFVDASPGDGNFDEDYGRDDGTNPYPASSVLARVLTGSDSDAPGTIAWGWDTLDANGCTGNFDALGGETVDVVWHPWTYSDTTDNSVVALDCTGSPCEVETHSIVGLELDSSGPSVPSNQVQPETPALWAVEFAERRAPFWASATSYIRVAHEEGGSFANRGIGDQPTINVNSYGHDSKFTIAHEYGHLQGQLIPDSSFGPGDIDCSLGGGGAGAHEPGEKEWQSCAAVEGMADWYGALTWYEVEQASTDSANFVFVSGSGPSLQASSIGGAPVCTFDAATPVPPASGYEDDRCNYGQAVELDWAGALFDFYRDESVDFVTVGTLLTESLPWSGNESEFWANLMAAAALHLTPGEVMAWSDIAADKEIDQ